jgi:thiol-disulfide isomerase/thioredoxin
MAVVGVLMLVNLDTRFQNAIASDLPSFLVNPTGGLERSHSVSKALASVRGAGAHAPMPESTGLKRLFPAPAIQGTQRWFNTPGGQALSLDALRGQKRVVLIDFWTYTCINCIRTLPQLKAWDARYRADGLTIIGVHTPEFPFEKDAGNVASAIRQDGLRYPVVQDNQYATWNAYGNQYWPAHYLIGADGYVRYVHFGEGEYARTENAIRALLAEAGRSRLGGMSKARVQAPGALATPETYLGSQRAERFENGAIVDGSHDYGSGRPSLPLSGFAYRGRWRVGPEGATAGSGARLYARFQARRVYLVLGSAGKARRVRVLLDGRPLRTVTVDRQRLYTLADLPRSGGHDLELRPDAGVEGYAFTFG